MAQIELKTNHVPSNLEQLTRRISDHFLMRCINDCPPVYNNGHSYNAYQIISGNPTRKDSIICPNEKYYEFDYLMYKAFSGLNDQDQEFSCAVTSEKQLSQYITPEVDNIYFASASGNLQLTYPSYFDSISINLHNKAFFQHSIRAPLTTVLLVDYSSTVQTSGILGIIKRTVRDFMKRLTENDNVGMVIHRGTRYSDIIEVPISPCTSNQQSILDGALEEIPFGDANRLDQTLSLSVDMLKGISNITNTIKNIVLFTSGKSLNGLDTEISVLESLDELSNNFNFSVHSVLFTDINNPSANIPKHMSCMTGGIYANYRLATHEIFEMFASESTDEIVIMKDTINPHDSQDSYLYAKTIYDRNFQNYLPIGVIIFATNQQDGATYLKNVKIDGNNFTAEIEVLERHFKVHNPNGLGVCEREQMIMNKCEIPQCSQPVTKRTCDVGKGPTSIGSSVPQNIHYGVDINTAMCLVDRDIVLITKSHYHAMYNNGGHGSFWYWKDKGSKYASFGNDFNGIHTCNIISRFTEGHYDKSMKQACEENRGDCDRLIDEGKNKGRRTCLKFFGENIFETRIDAQDPYASSASTASVSMIGMVLIFIASLSILH